MFFATVTLSRFDRRDCLPFNNANELDLIKSELRSSTRHSRHRGEALLRKH